MPDRLLRIVPDVVDRIGVGKTRALQLMDSGALPYVKLGRLRMVRESELENFISSMPNSVPSSTTVTKRTAD
jgi:excisionase family DNA binding protein